MDQGRIIVITGSPGTGKTTTVSTVAKESDLEKSVHMHTDDFYHYLSKGAIPPHLPESNEQNLIVIEAFLEAAKRYARGGYDVIVDGIVGPWFLEPWLNIVQEHYEVHYIVLDKVFALCDYMLLDDMQKHSRHIYDIYQLLGRVELNEEFRALIHRVREDRKYHSLCVSAQNNADIPALLEQVIETECYKKDYEEHTRTMLYTPCNYEEAITGLKKIIDSGMFGKDEEYEKIRYIYPFRRRRRLRVIRSTEYLQCRSTISTEIMHIRFRISLLALTEAKRRLYFIYRKTMWSD